MRYPVVFGEAFVQECVIRPEQVEQAPVLAQHTFDEKLGFLPKGLPQVVIKVGEEA